MVLQTILARSFLLPSPTMGPASVSLVVQWNADDRALAWLGRVR
jgi:hypothetical protein